jgi:hypothetical protein
MLINSQSRNSFWTIEPSQTVFLRTEKICAKIMDANKNKRPWTRNGS